MLYASADSMSEMKIQGFLAVISYKKQCVVGSPLSRSLELLRDTVQKAQVIKICINLHIRAILKNIMGTQIVTLSSSLIFKLEITGLYCSNCIKK